RDAQEAVLVVHRELVQDAALDDAAAGIAGGDRALADRELVDRRQLAHGLALVPAPAGDLLVGYGHVERVARRVDPAWAAENGGDLARAIRREVDREQAGERAPIGDARLEHGQVGGPASAVLPGRQGADVAAVDDG